MTNNRHEFIKNLAKETKGRRVIDSNGVYSHLIIKCDIAKVGEWNATHKSKLAVAGWEDQRWFDVDAFNGYDAVVDDAHGSWYYRKSDSNLLKRIANKYQLDSITVKFNKVDVSAIRAKRAGNQPFNELEYFKARKASNLNKAILIRAKRAWEALPLAKIDELIDSIKRLVNKEFEWAYNPDTRFYFIKLVEEVARRIAKAEHLKATAYYNFHINKQTPTEAFDDLVNYCVNIKEVFDIWIDHVQSLDSFNNLGEDDVIKRIYYTSTSANTLWI